MVTCSARLLDVRQCVPCLSAEQIAYTSSQASELECRGVVSAPLECWSDVTATGVDLQSPRGETVARRLRGELHPAEQPCNEASLAGSPSLPAAMLHQRRPGGFSQAHPISHVRHQQNLSKAEGLRERGLVEELLGLRERANRANSEHVVWQQHTAPQSAAPHTPSPVPLPESAYVGSSFALAGDTPARKIAREKASKIPLRGGDKENIDGSCPDARAQSSSNPAESLPLSLEFPLPRHLFYSQNLKPPGPEPSDSRVRPQPLANEVKDAAIKSSERGADQWSGMMSARLCALQALSRPLEPKFSPSAMSCESNGHPYGATKSPGKLR